ncbi:MAG: sialidase family protein [Verrucomicrobiota bacterium]|nr:sialidase family protein [Verrucomicrobiota bacterium]
MLFVLLNGQAPLEGPSILISSIASAGSLGLLEVGTTLFSDRAYTMVECPEELQGKSFLRTSINGTRFQCIRPGVLTVLTPNPNDSPDSVALALLEQGYALTPQPSFQLMLTGAANRVEVYQKTLTQGEWTDIPKWGVVVGMDEITIEPPFYMNPPQVITNPPPKYASSSRRFQGIPSMAVAPGGRLWAVWYGGAGPTEDEFNYVIATTSADGGLTWSDEKLVIDPDGDGPVRAFDPQIWIDPNGKMWVFWMQAIGHDGQIAGVWAITTDQPEAENPVWSAPVRLTDGIMMGKPMVLSSGEWVLPASTWYTDNSSRMVVSLDQGSTWQLRGAANVPAADRNADEHMIVERMDGSLWMWIRTQYGIGESVSTNRGETWSPVVPSDVKHTVARFFIRRLVSGNLLLVKHGGIQDVIGRSHLTAFISADDGVTWSGGLLLDERSGVSYPDGMQESNGTIYITYDWSRTVEKEILMARFSEEDVLAGELVHTNSQLRLLVNKAIYNPLVFQEDFQNPDADAPLANIGWHANVGSAGTSVDANSNGLLGPILSIGDYIFYRVGSSGVPVLSWTDNAAVDTIGVINFIKNISVRLRNDEASENLKIALKVNDSWYVSQTVLNGTANAVVGIDVQSIAWNSLDFVSGSRLAEGGVATLPTVGAVQAVGVFDESTTATKAVRIDNYTVETVP